MERFRNLPANWDSYGAEPIHPEAIDIAKALIPQLPWAHHAVPTADGGVAIMDGQEARCVEVTVTLLEGEVLGGGEREEGGA